MSVVTVLYNFIYTYIFKYAYKMNEKNPQKHAQYCNGFARCINQFPNGFLRSCKDEKGGETVFYLLDARIALREREKGFCQALILADWVALSEVPSGSKNGIDNNGLNGLKIIVFYF